MRLGDYLYSDVTDSFPKNLDEFSYQKNSTGFNVWDADFGDVCSIPIAWLENNAKTWSKAWSLMESWYERGRKRGMADKAHQVRTALEI